MSVIEAGLLQAYASTDYRVRRPAGGYVSIRIGRALPPVLQTLADGASWGFLSAWNPYSQWRPRSANRSAQQHLLQRLRADPGCRWLPAIGVGENGWREASLWILGLTARQLDQLALEFSQHAWVGADAQGRATIHVAGTPHSAAATP